MKKPKISVLMAVHNETEYVQEAIESIRKQTCKNFEFLIVDDASTNETPKVLKKIAQKDKRIRLKLCKKNKGLTRQLNDLIKMAKGEYLARMDADDIALPKRFEKQVAFLEKNKEVALVGSYITEIDENGRAFKRKKRAGTVDISRLPTGSEAIKKAVLRYNPIVHPSVMARTTIIKKMRGYDDSLPTAQDYDLIIRLAARFPLRNIPEKLLQYRRRPGAISYKKRKNQEWCALRARYRAMLKGEYSFFESWKLIKPSISFLIPTKVKEWLLS